MKLTLLFLLSFSLSAQGQRQDSINVIYPKDASTWLNLDTTRPVMTSREITVRLITKEGIRQSAGFRINPKTKDSVFFVEGDTATILREFVKWHFEMNKERNKEAKELRTTIQSGVDFLNDLPAYYKNKTVNPSWPEYIEQLSRQGYKMIREKVKLTLGL